MRRFRNMWTLSDPSPSPGVGFMKWVKVKSKSGKHRNKRMHLKTNVCGCLTCNIFFSISHMRLAFEFHIAVEFPPAVRWGVVLGCDGGDRLEQSLGCGTDGKSLRLFDGQIGYWSTGGQNADKMVVEIIFPGKMAIPHFFGSCVYLSETAWWQAMKPQRQPFNVVFLDFYWDAWDQLENLELLLSLKCDESWWWKHHWWSKSHSHTGNQALGPPKSSFFVSTGWCLCHSRGSSWSKGSLWFHLIKIRVHPNIHLIQLKYF